MSPGWMALISIKQPFNSWITYTNQTLTAKQQKNQFQIQHKPLILQYLTEPFMTNLNKLYCSWRKVTSVKEHIRCFLKQRKHKITNSTSNFQNGQPFSRQLQKQKIIHRINDKNILGTNSCAYSTISLLAGQVNFTGHIYSFYRLFNSLSIYTLNVHLPSCVWISLTDASSHAIQYMEEPNLIIY